MTLPASGRISLNQVAAELGLALPLSLGDTRVRSLGGVASGAISLSHLHGKSGAAPLSATGYGDSTTANSQPGAGVASCAPFVVAGGGSGALSYQWEFTSNPDSCTLVSATSATCSVSHPFTKSANGSASATLRCTVRDGAGGVVVLNNISAYLEWTGNV